MKYITVTNSNDNSKILINPEYIVSIIEATETDSKSIVHLIRDTYHVAESKEELLALLE
ncbi:MAG: hypothetical protein PW786_00065 [Arachidicoccus sp.]|nr:hypothetical protein [Arachidicoccus sp.]